MTHWGSDIRECAAWAVRAVDAVARVAGRARVIARTEAGGWRIEVVPA